MCDVRRNREAVLMNQSSLQASGLAFVVEHADVTTNGNGHQACRQRVLPTEPLSQPKVVFFFNQMILVYSEKDKKLVVIKVPISDYMNVWE